MAYGRKGQQRSERLPFGLKPTIRRSPRAPPHVPGRPRPWPAYERPEHTTRVTITSYEYNNEYTLRIRQRAYVTHEGDRAALKGERDKIGPGATPSWER